MFHLIPSPKNMWFNLWVSSSFKSTKYSMYQWSKTLLSKAEVDNLIQLSAQHNYKSAHISNYNNKDLTNWIPAPIPFSCG